VLGIGVPVTSAWRGSEVGVEGWYAGVRGISADFLTFGYL